MIHKQQDNDKADMNLNELELRAEFLFYGGWRKYDRDDLMCKYDFTEEEANYICKLLAVYETIEEEYKAEREYEEF